MQSTISQFVEHYLVVVLIWFGIAEFVCRVLRLPYSPLGWLIRSFTSGVMNAIAWLIRTIITAFVEGARAAWRRYAP